METKEQRGGPQENRVSAQGCCVKIYFSKDSEFTTHRGSRGWNKNQIILQWERFKGGNNLYKWS